MKHNRMVRIVLLLAALLCPGAVLAYPRVNIANKISFNVWGYIHYVNIGKLCKNAYWQADPSETFTASSANACLIKEITVNNSKGEGNSYTSSGTSYRKFEFVNIDGVLTLRRR